LHSSPAPDRGPQHRRQAAPFFVQHAGLLRSGRRAFVLAGFAISAPFAACLSAWDVSTFGSSRAALGCGLVVTGIERLGCRGCSSWHPAAFGRGFGDLVLRWRKAARLLVGDFCHRRLVSAGPRQEVADPDHRFESLDRESRGRSDREPAPDISRSGRRSVVLTRSVGEAVDRVFLEPLWVEPRVAGALPRWHG